MDRCVNCGIATSRCKALLGRRPLNDEKTLLVFKQWLAPQSVNNSDLVCQACWNLAQNPDVKLRQLGHKNVCLRCGRSLKSLQCTHELNTDSTREMKIYNFIQQYATRAPVQRGSHICHSCWVAADRNAVQTNLGSTSFQEHEIKLEAVYLPHEHSEEMESEAQDFPTEDSEEIQTDAQNLSTEPLNKGVAKNQPEPTIVLPDYLRAIETQSKCFIEGCQRKERNRVPLSIRKMLLSQYKYYIPENNRLCNKHLAIEAHDILDKTNYVQTFTARQIEDMMSL